jgi:AraC-like DNA-binding protein
MLNRIGINSLLNVRILCDKLLLTPTCSIRCKDIAYDLNFSSYQYFTRVVMKFTGKSPKELR